MQLGMKNKKKNAVLVTGCNGDIGISICKEFADRGYLVIGTDVHNKPKFHCDFYMACDLIDFVKNEAVSLRFKNSINLFLDENHAVLKSLVNNAALQIIKPFKDLSTDDFLNSHIVNSIAPFSLIKCFEDKLNKSNGSIVNIGSIHSKLTKPNFCAYSTSKSSLSGLTRALAVEISQNITINAINPAAVETEMLAQGFEGKMDKYKELEGFHPVGRIASPVEIAKLVAFLCIDNLGFITGSEIAIDGGIGSRLHDPM
jgi:NAD(P)-dependent dehydrogenase (short-subunit alcohol dehydrogenase family)